MLDHPEFLRRYFKSFNMILDIPQTTSLTNVRQVVVCYNWTFSLPGRVAQSVGHLTEQAEEPVSIPSPATSFVVEIDRKIFSTIIFPIPLIHKGVMSVTGRSTVD